MRLEFQATVAKRAEDPNEDVSGALLFRGRYALSDGATESFAPRQWAGEVIQAFLDRPHLDRDWLRHAAARYHQRFNRDAMTWSAQAAFDRGSFATLVGVTLSRCRPLARIFAIGDSLAVLAEGDQLRATFPYQRPEQFHQRPLLLASHLADNARLLAPGVLTAAAVQWSLHDLRQPALLLMTDALGAWLLTDPARRLPILLHLKSPVQFASLIDTQRRNGHLRRDDTTLLRIR
jgi:hypothetical protein